MTPLGAKAQGAALPAATFASTACQAKVASNPWRGQERMIANREEGANPHSADHFLPRLSTRTQWNAFEPDDLQAAQERTRNWLSARQEADGHWLGELEGDTILESES